MWFLWSVAWRNLWRHRRRSLITAAAAATAVAMVMATMAFMDGMFTDLFEVMVEQKLGHVQVRHPDFPTRRQVWDTVTDRTDLLERIDAMPDTVASSPTLSSYGLLGGASESAGARIVGIDPARDQRVTPLHERVIEGRYLAEAPALEILLGWSLAEDIQVGVGDEVVAVTQASDGSVGNELYTVVGLYRTGDEAMDNAGGYLHLADAEDLFVLHDQAHGVTLLTDGPDAIEPFVAAVRAGPPRRRPS
ncbi:MAG: ABC transporter permease [Deltaproteobacteria bacterium]|nr:ABC transporter permease [Deltaproteobacteria bacterium]